MMKVYYAPFARSLRILWTLEELNAPYEPVRVQFPPRLAQPDYLHINPLGQIPTLMDGDIKLFESMGACEYVNDVQGGDLVIAGGQPGRADYLQWLWYGEATLMPPVGTMVRNTFGPEDSRDGAALAEARAMLFERLALVEAQLEGRQYLAGDRFTLADVSVAYVLNLGAMLRVSGDYSPNIAAYFARMMARPAFQAAAAQA
ncbi:MAG: glutathione S-transferase family protein [Caulobacter sp.]|nr:glutathione S-transferase family protein [Caulobacter sp.]